MRESTDQERLASDSEILNQVLKANSGVLPVLHPAALKDQPPIYFQGNEIVSVMRTSGEVQLMRVHKVQGVQVVLRPYKAKSRV